MGERLIVPLGLTRPVPCTRPPARARIVPFLPLARRVEGASVEVFESREKSSGERGR